MLYLSICDLIIMLLQKKRSKTYIYQMIFRFSDEVIYKLLCSSYC